MRDDEEKRARRRFLDEFQKRICAGRVEVLGAIEDADPVAAPPRRLLKQVDGAADILDPDFRKEPFVFFVPLAAQENEIGMRHRGDLTGDRMLGGDKKIRPRLARGSRRIGVRQKKTSEAPGEGGFAYAERSANNESLRQVSRQIGQNELPFGLGMTEAIIAIARMPSIFKTVGLGT